jgi:hypothetical protein
MKCNVVFGYCQKLIDHLSAERFFHEDLLHELERLLPAPSTGFAQTKLRALVCLILAEEAVGEAAKRMELTVGPIRAITPAELQEKLVNIESQALLERGELEMFGIEGGRITLLGHLSDAIEQHLELLRQVHEFVRSKHDDNARAALIGATFADVVLASNLRSQDLLQYARQLLATQPV